MRQNDKFLKPGTPKDPAKPAMDWNKIMKERAAKVASSPRAAAFREFRKKWKAGK